MRLATSLLIGFMLIAGTAGSGNAASLQVAPVHVEVAAPASGTALSVQNIGKAPLNVQLRVFKWSMRDGRSVLAPTTDVVASPPATKLKPGAVHTIRLIRTAPRPVSAEESYRLLVDEIPVSSRARGGNVSFLLRYSIPVFFVSARKSFRRLTWRAQVRGRKLIVEATNSGGRRVRVSALKISDPSGRPLAQNRGLVGYVLRGATARWTLPLSWRLRPGTRVTITGAGDDGPIKERTVVQARR